MFGYLLGFADAQTHKGQRDREPIDTNKRTHPLRSRK